MKHWKWTSIWFRCPQYDVWRYFCLSVLLKWIIRFFTVFNPVLCFLGNSIKQSTAIIMICDIQSKYMYRKLTLWNQESICLRLTFVYDNEIPFFYYWLPCPFSLFISKLKHVFLQSNSSSWTKILFRHQLEFPLLCLDDEDDGIRNRLNLVKIKSQISYAAFLYLIIIRFNLTSDKL